jgi:carboxypeptidase Taq
MNAYEELKRIYQRINRLGHVSAICGWDEAVNMPKGGGDSRSDALTELGLVIHEIITDPKTADLVEEALKLDASKPTRVLNDWQQANLEIIAKGLKRSACIPTDLLEASQRASMKSEQAWRLLRSQNDWKSFEPFLTEVVNLERKTAEVLSETFGMSKYDALLDGYQDNLRSDEIDEVFGELRKFLPDFITKVVEKQKGETVVNFEGNYPISAQKNLGEEVMKRIGFDFDHGRLDTSHHPFCGGVPQDVRMTTRYNERNWTTALMGVIHETGHGKYEQGLPLEWIEQPVGSAVSIAVHESQSLLMEMQVGRSYEFMHFLSPIVTKYLFADDDNLDAYGADNMFKLYTRVRPSFIRVDADEVTYPCHIILRYEIERDLIEGKLDVADLPEAWDVKMQELLGLSTKDNYKDGCMQDVHWPSGRFGYFPSYTLGAMYAAQMFAAAKKEHPNMLSRIENGDFTTLNDWLRKRVWSKGSSVTVEELLEQSTGETLNINFFKDHLISRYLNTPDHEPSTATVLPQNVVDFHQLQKLRRSSR